MLNPEITKEEEVEICPTIETLKEQFAKNVEKKFKNAKKEGYIYDEDKVQKETEEEYK